MARVEAHPGLRYAWHGPSLLITTPRGECGDLPLSGYFFREARHLRTLRLEIDGERPWLCESAILAPDRLGSTYVHPELEHFGGGGTGSADGQFGRHRSGIPYRALALRLELHVEVTGLEVTLIVASHAGEDVECEVAWIVDADFLDLLAVHLDMPTRPGPVRSEISADAVRLIAEDPALPYSTCIRARGGGPWMACDGRLATTLRLSRGQSTTLTLNVDAIDPRLPMPDRRRADARWRAWRNSLTRIEARRERILERIIQRNVEDIASFALLDGPEEEWIVPQAGLPFYPALFGRDAITGAWQSAMLDRGDAIHATLTRLGRLQGERDDPMRDEQRGRIVQQARLGPLSRTGVLPYDRYFGDFASPLMYVVALAHLFAWTGDRALVQRHWDTARRILDWAREYGDPDRDGFLEYHNRSPKGPTHAGWKDSGDAIVRDDGTPVPPPLGTCELQGYWFAAQQLMAVLSWVQGARGDAGDYWQAANELRIRFNRDFWMEDEGFIGLALDADKRLVRSVTSNAGHCLATGIVSREHLPRVVGRLFESDLFSGWGIRTLSSRHVAYDPISYHRGSVWAVENSTIAFGLRRFGFDTRALDLARALFDLADLYPDGRIPETVGGYARGEWPTPGLYPRANAPQLWNASAFPLLVHTMLGLQPVAPLDLLVVDPVLPSWLPEIVLRGLRLGGATATLRFWRDEHGASHAEILHKRGTLHLLRQPPPEAIDVRVRDRFAALADRVLHH
ncbi:MAG TPA: glycogen debranching N-terminal domain-containing protein [Gemmatimonadaceae bacterium]